MFGTYTLSVNAAGAAAAPVSPPPTQPPAPVVAPPPLAQAPAGAAVGAPMRIAAGGAHSCALVGDGAVMCWGKNNWGQLGDGSTTDRATPVPLNSGLIQPGLRFVEITAGAEHTCGLTGDGRAWCWGYNFAGQLGDNSPHNRTIVRQADVIAFKHPLPVAVAG
ncbi:MAG: hypothetical protein NTY23_12605, partial [Chloroflexi bacterium]|nr:hypothetical protein [Chloroflexota bacterium]